MNNVSLDFPLSTRSFDGQSIKIKDVEDTNKITIFRKEPPVEGRNNDE